MNGNYHLNKFYAQEKINARLHEAESHRLARSANGESSAWLAAGRVYARISQVISQLARSLEALGNTRVAPLQR